MNLLKGLSFDVTIFQEQLNKHLSTLWLHLYYFTLQLNTIWKFCSLKLQSEFYLLFPSLKNKANLFNFTSKRSENCSDRISSTISWFYWRYWETLSLSEHCWDGGTVQTFLLIAFSVTVRTLTSQCVQLTGIQLCLNESYTVHIKKSVLKLKYMNTALTINIILKKSFFHSQEP